MGPAKGDSKRLRSLFAQVYVSALVVVSALEFKHLPASAMETHSLSEVVLSFPSLATGSMLIGIIILIMTIRVHRKLRKRRREQLQLSQSCPDLAEVASPNLSSSSTKMVEVAIPSLSSEELTELGIPK